MPCLTDGELTICVPGEWRVLSVVDLGVRWCFYCRDRVRFTDTCSTDDNPWYEPTWATACPRGHLDGDLFPGRSRDGE